MVPAACPVGHYCPAGTGVSTSYPCPPGSYFPSTQNSERSNCTACPSGQYCESAGLSAPTGECHARYYCTGGADSATPNNHLVRVTLCSQILSYFYTYVLTVFIYKCLHLVCVSHVNRVIIRFIYLFISFTHHHH